MLSKKGIPYEAYVRQKEWRLFIIQKGEFGQRLSGDLGNVNRDMLGVAKV